MKKVDIFLLVLFPILAFIITILFKTNFLTSTFLFFGVPYIYLTIKNPKSFFKGFVFALLMAITGSLTVDVLAALDGSWIVPSAFSFKFLGLSTIENCIFGFLWLLLMVSFYEYFFEDNKKEKIIYPRMKYLVLICVSVSGLFLITYLLNNIQIFSIPYVYAYVSLVFIMQIIVFLHFHPDLLKRFIKLAAYFFFLDLLLEIAGLHNHLWLFPGKHFLGFVHIFNYSFPIEEFIFWMIFATPAFLVIYEYFDDLDLK